MNIIGNSVRWFCIAAVVMLVMTGFYYLSAFQAERGKAAPESPIQLNKTTKQPPSTTTLTATSPLTARSQADPTATWKAYTNHPYGYTVRYPLDWTTRVEKDNAGRPEGEPSVTQHILVITGPGGPGRGLISVDIFRNPTNIPLPEWLKNNLPGPYDKPSTIYGIQIPGQPNSSLDGKPAIQLQTTPSSQAPTATMIYAANQSYVYKLSVFHYPGIDEQIYSGMIRSFAFR